MSEHINNRISAIIENEGISEITFSKSLGKSSSFFNTAKKKNSIVSADVISKILDMYPKYSMRWLLSGKGSMIVREGNELNMVQEPEVQYGEVDYFKEILMRYFKDPEVKLALKRALE